jgi:hypothetical protein
MRRRLFNLVTVLTLLVCVAVVWPRRGPPDFRYTGADPARQVWSLGWPVAVAIHDPDSGLHVGPLALVVGPVLAIAIVTLAMVKQE